MDVISCLQWLPRKYCDSDFFRNYIHGSDPDSEVEVASSVDEVETKEQEHDDFDLDHYDDDDFVPSMEFNRHSLCLDEQMFTLTSKDEKLIEEDEEDVRARKLSDSDRVIIAGVNTDYFSSLVVYLYDVDTCGLEPNHTIQLSNFPLCCEVVGDLEAFPLLASGTFEPAISLWNLREINLLSPFMTLDCDLPENVSVLSMSNSPSIRHLLAGGYSDNKVRIWDLKEKKVLESFSHHDNKVQVVLWNPADPSLLFTGGFDKKVAITDVRQPTPTSTFSLDSDIECALWSSETNTVVGLENGEVLEYDWRAGKKVWSLKSHKKSCTSVSRVKDLIVTCGLDSKAKVYRTKPSEPVLLEEKNLKAGPLFSSSPSPDDDYLLSFGGKNLVVWDLETIEHLNKS